jgi:hypothetical protein
MLPSPTAAATRLTEWARPSPTAMYMQMGACEGALAAKLSALMSELTGRLAKLVTGLVLP